MIRANIETEIAPIVGTQEQADDLISFINQTDMEKGIWNTNIFGKTVEQLVNDGITAKVAGFAGKPSKLIGQLLYFHTVIRQQPLYRKNNQKSIHL